MSAELRELLELADELHDELDGTPSARSSDPGQRIDLDPEDVGRGLAQLVLTVVELLRQLMERQAIRRMDAGTLTDEQEERLGSTFLQLNEHMEQLQAHFGLSAEDLNLDLGPLGRLM